MGTPRHGHVAVLYSDKIWYWEKNFNLLKFMIRQLTPGLRDLV